MYGTHPGAWAGLTPLQGFLMDMPGTDENCQALVKHTEFELCLEQIFAVKLTR